MNRDFESKSYLALAIVSDRLADVATAKLVAHLHRKLAAKYRAMAATAAKRGVDLPGDLF